MWTGIRQLFQATPYPHRQRARQSYSEAVSKIRQLRKTHSEAFKNNQFILIDYTNFPSRIVLVNNSKTE